MDPNFFIEETLIVPITLEVHRKICICSGWRSSKSSHILSDPSLVIAPGETYKERCLKLGHTYGHLVYIQIAKSEAKLCSCLQGQNMTFLRNVDLVPGMDCDLGHVCCS